MRALAIASCGHDDVNQVGEKAPQRDWPIDPVRKNKMPPEGGVLFYC